MRKLLIAIPLIVILFGCNEKKLFTPEECKKESLYFLQCVKNKDYKTMYKTVNMYKRIKKRDISESYISKEFDSLSQFLMDKTITELKIETIADESIKTDKIGTLYVDVFYKDKGKDIYIFSSKYSYGDDGEYFELDQFINKLENHKTNAVEFMPTPPKKP